MGEMASQIASVSIVCLTVCSGSDQRKHQSSTSLAFVWGNHRWPGNSPHKGSVTRKMFPFDDVIMFRDDCMIVGLWWKKQIPKHKNIIFYKNCKQLLNMGRGLFEHVIYWSTSAAIGHERLDGYACNIADIELNWKPLTYALNNECIFNFNYIKYSSWKVRVQWTDRGPVTHICVI